MATSLTTKFKVTLSKEYNGGISLVSGGGSLTSPMTRGQATYSNTDNDKNYDATVTIATGVGQIDLAGGVTDAFGNSLTITELQTIGVQTPDTNTGNITMTVNRTTGTDLVWEVQPDSSMGSDFGAGFTGTVTSIDLTGTNDDTIDIFLTGS